MDENRNNLSKNQKLALVGLTVFSICFIVLWVYQLNTNIRRPFYYITKAKSNPAVVVNSEDTLKSQDTDGDGLSDWDEVNIYSTSAYLADSDSDSISDGVEVKNGTNPNCPEGSSCNSTLASNSSSTVLNIMNSAGLAISTTSSNTAALTNLLTGTSDATSLRKLLIESGLDKKALDQVTDEELIQKYQDFITNNSNQ